MKSRLRNYGFLVLGILLLALNRVRHSITGYRTPTPFSARDESDVKKAVEHDQQIVRDYVFYLREFTRQVDPIAGKAVLELGPGGDLGVALGLLALGARSYTGFDAHNLATRASPLVYDTLLATIESSVGTTQAAEVRHELDQFDRGCPTRLTYVVDGAFDFSALGGEQFDLILSNAAFEHFDDVQSTLAGMTRVARKDSVFFAIVDLQTHTRVVREADPLSIYRVPDEIYQLVKFRGIPNRVQVADYRAALRKCGWEEVAVWPLTTVAEDYWKATEPFLPRRFQNADTKLLSVAICARKALA